MQEKQRFIDVFKQSQIGYEVLVSVAGSVDPAVPQYVINNMMVGKPVSKVNAETVLKILSEFTGKILTLDNVEITILEGGSDATK